MIQLTYQPAFDPFHATFRFLRLREGALGDKPIPRDHFRILDFYLLFPFRSGDIRVQPTHRRFKKVAQAYENARPYGDLPDDRILFNRMNAIQSAALDTLAVKGLLDADQYKRGLIARTGEEPVAALQDKVVEANTQQADLMEFLRTLANEYDLLGPNGLKDRTALMEFAYDAA
jgi:hypothetical protein